MKLKKTMKTLSVIGLMLAVSTAATASECADVVKSCDNAIKAADRVIDLRVRQISAQEDLIKFQGDRINQLEKDKNSLLKNPLFYLVIGIVGGVIIQKR